MTTEISRSFTSVAEDMEEVAGSVHTKVALKSEMLFKTKSYLCEAELVVKVVTFNSISHPTVFEK